MMSNRETVIKNCENWVNNHKGENYLLTYSSVLELLAALKERKAVEGHWIPIESPTGVEAFGIKEMTVQDVRCSVCDAEEDVSFAAYRFCPRCGARMEGVK